MSERSCQTCRSWRENPPVWRPGMNTAEPNPWHACSRLFVVTKRTRRGFEVGNVVTDGEADEHELHVEPLNTAAHFSCAGWQQGHAVEPAQRGQLDLWGKGVGD